MTDSITFTPTAADVGNLRAAFSFYDANAGIRRMKFAFEWTPELDAYLRRYLGIVPSATTPGPVLPKDPSDAMQFYCAENWRHTVPAAEARFDDPTTGYSGTERNFWMQDHINQVAQRLAYFVVSEEGDKSPANVVALARQMAAPLSDDLKAWAQAYDGHWFQADGSVVR